MPVSEKSMLFYSPNLLSKLYLTSTLIDDESSYFPGFSTWLVQYLVYLRRFDVWIINLIVSVFTATITEVVSNTAAANILLPILKEMSITLCTNPTYLGSAHVSIAIFSHNIYIRGLKHAACEWEKWRFFKFSHFTYFFYIWLEI